MIKLIASDLDGTLLRNGAQTLNPEIYDLILKFLLDKLGISPEEMIAFGNQENDLEMLALAGRSYAMASAKQEVKEIADAATESVEEVLKELLASLEDLN